MGRKKLKGKAENMKEVIRTYRKMLELGKISEGGSAYKRLAELIIKWK